MCSSEDFTSFEACRIWRPGKCAFRERHSGRAAASTAVLGRCPRRLPTGGDPVGWPLVASRLVVVLIVGLIDLVLWLEGVRAWRRTANDEFGG
jgi:hypothetical protein